MRLLDILFPKYCLSCGQAGQYICPMCLKRVPLSADYCIVCKQFSLGGATHRHCKSKADLDGVVSIWRYQGVIKQSIQKVKYNFASDIVEELSGHIIRQLGDYTRFQGSLIAPIPLHHARFNLRGFNQSDLIARRITSPLGSYYDATLLKRISPTIPQVQLSKEQRLRNLSGKFAVNRGGNVTMVKRIVLCDDVITTGTTIFEAAKVLKLSGAREVWGFSIAR